MPSLRDVQADPSAQYTLTNIDNPNDIAQELSNLQALRRMSMDVGNIKDPDMPHMSLSAMPSIAPSGDDDEADPSRLLWVPARVHPELAPGEFKSFLETRVQTIRRRSRDGSLSPDGALSRNNSGSSLRRQKSTLSRQIDDPSGPGRSAYVDGAERLARQQSQRSSELSLDDLVKDPSKAVQKLAQESLGGEDGPEGNPDDKPILPMAPGMGLRRSTRTTYRKGGSLRSGSKRMAPQRFQEQDDSGVPPVPEAPPGHTLTRVQSEPVAENFSRPSRSGRRGQTYAQDEVLSVKSSSQNDDESQFTASPVQTYQDQLPVRSSSTQHYDSNVQSGNSYQDSRTHYDDPSGQYAQSSSSRQASQQNAEPQPEPSVTEPPPKSNRRKVSQPTPPQPPPQQQWTSKTPSQPAPAHSLNEQLSSNASQLPGQSRTDSLTFIPTFSQEEKKSDKKSKKERDDDASSVKSTSSAWKWFKSSDEKKERKEEKKSKAKALVERAQDNARLDVIQTSIDKTAGKARESLVLERDNADNKLQEERRKESNRKTDTKKEKDGSIFSSIFGGSKKKEEKEKTSKKSQHLRVPSEPPAYKPQQPDVDYHWTRFPLLEERAIYRMAHIKLANPRRPLLSQVLLSNFMYSYLAIVQAMHPNMNVPISPQQKRLEEEARRKREEEEYLAQQQMQDQDDQYDYDYHRVGTHQAAGGNILR